jgi:hypothetical protein
MDKEFLKDMLLATVHVMVIMMIAVTLILIADMIWHSIKISAGIAIVVTWAGAIISVKSRHRRNL